MIDDILTIGKTDYQVKKGELEQNKLLFFPENPRVYSVLNLGNEKPTQAQIEEVMCKADHVKQLKE